MLGTFVLIVVFFGNYSATSMNQEFNSLENCKKALDGIVSAPDVKRKIMYSACVKK